MKYLILLCFFISDLSFGSHSLKDKMEIENDEKVIVERPNKKRKIEKSHQITCDEKERIKRDALLDKIKNKPVDSINLISAYVDKIISNDTRDVYLERFEDIFSFTTFYFHIIFIVNKIHETFLPSPEDRDIFKKNVFKKMMSLLGKIKCTQEISCVKDFYFSLIKIIFYGNDGNIGEQEEGFLCSIYEKHKNKEDIIKMMKYHLIILKLRNDDSIFIEKDLSMIEILAFANEFKFKQDPEYQLFLSHFIDKSIYFFNKNVLSYEVLCDRLIYQSECHVRDVGQKVTLPYQYLLLINHMNSEHHRYYHSFYLRKSRECFSRFDEKIVVSFSNECLSYFDQLTQLSKFYDCVNRHFLSQRFSLEDYLSVPPHRLLEDYRNICLLNIHNSVCISYEWKIPYLIWKKDTKNLNSFFECFLCYIVDKNLKIEADRIDRIKDVFEDFDEYISKLMEYEEEHLDYYQYHLLPEIFHAKIALIKKIVQVFQKKKKQTAEIIPLLVNQYGQEITVKEFAEIFSNIEKFPTVRKALKNIFTARHSWDEFQEEILKIQAAKAKTASNIQG